MNPPAGTTNLSETVRKLEARVAALEKILQSKEGMVLLSCGASSITMKKTSIEMESNEVTIKASGNVSLKAGRNVVLKGSKIAEN